MIEDATELHYANQAMATLGNAGPADRAGRPGPRSWARLDSVPGPGGPAEPGSHCACSASERLRRYQRRARPRGRRTRCCSKLGTKLPLPRRGQQRCWLPGSAGDEFALLIEESEGTRTVTPLVEEGAAAESTTRSRLLGHRLVRARQRRHRGAPRGAGSSRRSCCGDATMALHWAKEGGQWRSGRCSTGSSAATRDRAQLQLALTMPVALDKWRVHRCVPTDSARSATIGWWPSRRSWAWDHPRARAAGAGPEFLALAERTGPGDAAFRVAAAGGVPAGRASGQLAFGERGPGREA